MNKRYIWIEYTPSAANPVREGDQCRFALLDDSCWRETRHPGLMVPEFGVIYRRRVERE